MEIYYNKANNLYFYPIEVVDVSHPFWYYGYLWYDGDGDYDFIPIYSFSDEWTLVDDMDGY